MPQLSNGFDPDVLNTYLSHIDAVDGKLLSFKTKPRREEAFDTLGELPPRRADEEALDQVGRG